MFIDWIDTPRLLSTFERKIPSWAADASDMYSASQLDRATVGCSLVWYGWISYFKYISVVDLRLSVSVAQFTSANPVSVRDWGCSVKHRLMVPLRYRSTLLTAFHSSADIRSMKEARRNL
jgi:hypothetical protein